MSQTRRHFLKAGLSASLFLPAARTLADCPPGYDEVCTTYGYNCECLAEEPPPSGPVGPPAPVEPPPDPPAPAPIGLPGDDPVSTDPIDAATGGPPSGTLTYVATGGQSDVGFPPVTFGFDPSGNSSMITDQGGGLGPSLQAGTSLSNSYPGTIPSGTAPSGASSAPLGQDYLTGVIAATTIQLMQVPQGSDAYLSSAPDLPGSFSSTGYSPADISSTALNSDLTPGQASQLAGAGSLVSSIAQYTLKSATIGTNLRFYSSGFYGNQYVAAFRISPIATMLGNSLTGAGIAIDLMRALDGQIPPAYAALNISVGLLAIFVGTPEVAVLAGAYYLTDAFFPNVTLGIANDIANNIKNFITNPDMPGSSYFP
jgi:hypothetical protein